MIMMMMMMMHPPPRQIHFPPRMCGWSQREWEIWLFNQSRLVVWTDKYYIYIQILGWVKTSNQIAEDEGPQMSLVCSILRYENQGCILGPRLAVRKPSRLARNDSRPSLVLHRCSTVLCISWMWMQRYISIHLWVCRVLSELDGGKCRKLQFFVLKTSKNDAYMISFGLKHEVF